MQIVGRDSIDRDENDVHTIDIWFSERRRCWVVERLDVDGNQIGVAARCDTEADAADCLACWLQAHREVCLVALPGHRPAPRADRVSVTPTRHRAA